MERKTEFSYSEVLQNLKENKTCLGDPMFDDELENYKDYLTHLERMVLDLYEAKKVYALMRVDKRTLYLEGFKNAQIKPLRKLIRESIAARSIPELSIVSFDRQPDGTRLPILQFLGIIGEMSLFREAFNKLKNELTIRELDGILHALREAYEGSKFSQPLKLGGFPGVAGGDPCYIALAEWMLINLDDTKRNELLELYKSANTARLDSPIKLNNEQDIKSAYIQSYKLQDGHLESSVDPSKISAEADNYIARCVTLHNGEHLFWKLIKDYLSNQPSNAVSSDSKNAPASGLILGFLTEERIKLALYITAAVLLIAGLTTFTCGVLGLFAVGGFISLMGGTAFGMTVGGAACAGAGLGMGYGTSRAYGTNRFFNEPEKILPEKYFFVDPDAAMTGLAVSNL